MDSEKRAEFVAGRKAELTRSLDEHVATLDALETATSFDFDIATDLHPDLIDNSTPEGPKRLAFWQSLYEALATNPQYTVIVRTATGLVPGCYGFGQDAKYQIDATWVRIFKNLPQQAIIFSRDQQGNPRVDIDHPSTLITGGARNGRTKVPEGTVSSTDPTPLFNHDSTDIFATSEQDCEPRIYHYEDLAHLRIGHSDYSYDSGLNKYLPIRTTDFLRQEQALEAQWAEQ